MKITVDLVKFREALALASKACKRGPMPVLSCIRIAADKDTQRLTLAGTTLDIGIITSCPAEVSEAATFCVNGPSLLQIANAVRGEKVVMQLKAGNVTFACGSSNFKLHTIAADEWPTIPRVETPAAMTFEQADLAARIGAVDAAQSNDEGRYILNGVFVSRSAKGIDFVATDGRRLHVNSCNGATGGEDAALILPTSSVAALLGCLSFPGKVSIALGTRHVEAKIDREDGEVVFVSKVVEGNYPNWKQVLPKDPGAAITVVREDFVGAIKRAALAVSDKSSSIVVKVDGAMATISAQSSEFGDSNEDVAIENPTNASATWACNPRFLIEALQGPDADKVSIAFDPSNASVAPIRVNAEEFRSVIMPVRLS